MNKAINFSRFLFLIGFCPFFIHGTYAQSFNYGTESETALIEYHKGWQHILDFGEWTKAEEAFRRSVAADPNFLLGWSQVGRISNDPEERAVILNRLNATIPNQEGYVKDLLAVYLGSLEIIDALDLGQAVNPERAQSFIQNLYSTSGQFLLDYPDEVYIEAEYIEAIHSVDGPQAALDSMESRKITDKSPFFKSYQALLFAELGDVKEANKSLNGLTDLLPDRTMPSYDYTKANVLMAAEDNERAKEFVESCLDKDPKHTLAKRLLRQLEEN